MADTRCWSGRHGVSECWTRLAAVRPSACPTFHALVSNTTGLTGIVLQLGPFGGSQAGGLPVVAWSALYVGLALTLAVMAFARRDL